MAVKKGGGVMDGPAPPRSAVGALPSPDRTVPRPAGRTRTFAAGNRDHVSMRNLTEPLRESSRRRLPPFVDAPRLTCRPRQRQRKPRRGGLRRQRGEGARTRLPARLFLADAAPQACTRPRAAPAKKLSPAASCRRARMERRSAVERRRRNADAQLAGCSRPTPGPCVRPQQKEKFLRPARHSVVDA